MKSHVTRIDPPRLLVFTWGAGDVTFELERKGEVLLTSPTAGCRAGHGTLGVSAGWHAQPRHPGRSHGRPRAGPVLEHLEPAACRICGAHHGRMIPKVGTGFRKRSCASKKGATTTHITGTREEWLAARIALLAEEKELTRRSDALARRRQELPWVRVDKEHRFETDAGSAAGGSVRRALAASRLPPVRAGLQGGMPVLLGHRRVQLLRRPPGKPRCRVLGGVAGANREAAGIPAADGLDVSQLPRLQLRLQRLDHGGTAARGRRRIQLRARRPCSTYRRKTPPRVRSRSPKWPEPTSPATCASGRA